MKTVQITVPPEADGQRVDVFLVNFLNEIPTRSVAQRLLNDGVVKRENRGVETFLKKSFYPTLPLQKTLTFEVLSKNYRVKSGDFLACEIPVPVPLEAVAEDIPLNIVYEDSDLIVLDKPRGLVVHPAAGHHSGTLVNALLHHCDLSRIGGVLRPGIVHRLDKDTSGLMVAAKNGLAHLALAAQLERRFMGRTYNAVCVGAVKKDRLRIDLPIGRHPHDRKKMAVLTAPGARARAAATNIEVLKRFGNHTLIEAQLETGRTHQIRVHMAHIGNPVLGDTVYGGARQHDFGGQILHAVNLRFTHPSTKEEMEFNSPLPEYFMEAMKKIKTRE